MKGRSLIEKKRLAVGSWQLAGKRGVGYGGHGKGIREAKWSESIAMGSEAFVERVKEELGIRAT